MSVSQQDVILGRLLVQQQVIDQEQLDGIMQLVQTMGDMKLGDVLLDSSIVDEAQLAELQQKAAQIAARSVQAPARAAAPAPAKPAPVTTTPAAPAGAKPAAPPAKGRGGISVFTPIEAPAEPPSPVSAESLDLMLEAVEEAPPEPEPVKQVVMPSDFSAGSPREEIELILRVAADMEVSDLHLHSGQRIIVRKHGELLPQETASFDEARIEALVSSLLSDEQRAIFEDRGELDFAVSLPGIGRFRGNLYRQNRGLDAVFRYIPPTPPTLEQLGLPSSLMAVTEFHNGLVLCTGPAGCGKSTTMHALLHLINQTREDHILTIEDPIEFIHAPIKCAVNQRQVGMHTESFGRALRGALREDPDVIVVGELRDFETISLALSAAETGHLVLGTLHTSNVVRTINRLINVFPPDQHDQVRGMLSESLRAVVSQRLARTTSGDKRVPALEMMLVNKPIANAIKDNKTAQLRTILQTSGDDGMYLLDNSLQALLKSNTITREEAVRLAEEPKRFAAPAAGA